VWDADWLSSPNHIATRAWWCNEWGNNGGGIAGRILVRNDVNVNTATLPAYAPDHVARNGANYADVVVDGNLTDNVWQYVPYFDIQFGNTALRNAYPTVGPDRSGEWVTKGPAGAIDRGRARVKMFFKGDKLYIGADIQDQALSSFKSDEFFDGLQISMSIPSDSLRDPNAAVMGFRRYGFAVDSLSKGGSSRQWDATDSALGIRAISYGLKTHGTIDNRNDIDTGFTVELAIDLTKLGYAPGLTNKVVGLGVNYHDYDVTPTDTSGYRVWWFREWPWTSTPAFVLLDNSNLVTGVGDQENLPVANEFRLLGNYPNPFNPSTKIQFSVPGAGTAIVKVYDVLGKLVNVSELPVQAAGAQEKAFSAANLASGVYFYRVEFKAEGKGTIQISNTQKMVLMK
ncbi:MAG: T9SS type A sorting domain-containing protein, partial [bacterium]